MHTTQSCIYLTSLYCILVARGGTSHNIRFVFQVHDTNIVLPTHIAYFHAQVFQDFATLYSFHKQSYTTSPYQKHHDFINVIKSYCDDSDIMCLHKVDKLQAKAQDWISTQDPQSGRIHFEYPTFMDQSLQIKLDEILAVLPMLEEDNLDDVQQIMKDIEADIQEMSDVNVVYKHLALSVVSVAMESSKLWHGVYYDDKNENALFDVCGSPVSLLPAVLPFLIGADAFGVLMIPGAVIFAPIFFPLLFLFCSNVLSQTSESCLFPFVTFVIEMTIFAPLASFFACAMLQSDI